VIAAELARRYSGKISSVAFDPGFIIDKTDPEVKKRWLTTGRAGFFWWTLSVFFAKPPAVAGESIADLMLSHRNRNAINGALFKLDKRVEKPDKAMNDEVLGKRLWDELVLLTGLATAGEKEQANNSLERTGDSASRAKVGDDV
jgi:hypothetical protein